MSYHPQLNSHFDADDYLDIRADEEKAAEMERLFNIFWGTNGDLAEKFDHEELMQGKDFAAIGKKLCEIYQADIAEFYS